MKIKSIAISNILSFAPQTPQLTPNLNFQISGSDGSLHILIGPNGAGKSNLIEVLNNSLRKALFLPVVFNEQNLMTEKSGAYLEDNQKRQTLVVQKDQTAWNLAPHHGSSVESQQVNLVIELNDNDFNNIAFLLDHADDLNQILNSYSALSNLIQPQDLATIRAYTNLTVTVTYTIAQRIPTVTLESEGEPPVAFIKSYLLYFKVFQESIKLYNRYLRAEGQPEWARLKETFALLGSYRNYAGIGGTISVESNRSFQQVNERLRNESTRSGGGEEPAVFDLVRRKIGYAFYDIHYDYGVDESITRLYNEQPLSDINKLLSKYLGLQITVHKPNDIDPGMQMLFQRDGRTVETSELSSGEKGILHFIFTLYGFDLKNGVIIIDEPELHLHPQIQRSYLDLIEEVQKELDIQFIVATHSPIFVRQETIGHVFRCVKKDGRTEIINPIIATSQKALTKILDLTNSAKIFFVNRVILVEGETDEYFFRVFFDYLKNSVEVGEEGSWQKQIEDFEIVNVKGKGARKVWTEFLERFGLHVSFIGDWDNINEVASFDLSKYTDQYLRALEAAGQTIQQKGSIDGTTLFASIDKTLSDPTPQNLEELGQLKDYIAARRADYPSLIKHIRETDPAEWTRLKAAIDSAYAQKVFILKQGELENYLGLASKGIEHIIDFCQNGFVSWLGDSQYDSRRIELITIAQELFETSSAADSVS